MPTVPGILSIVLGLDPGELGIYGPTRKDTYTYSSIPVNLDDYDYPDPIYVPEVIGTVHLSELLDTKWEGRAWGEPGSWGMVFLNVRARQERGIICPTKFHEARESLMVVISKNLPEVTIHRTEELWECTGVPPDLMVRRDGYTFD